MRNTFALSFSISALLFTAACEKSEVVSNNSVVTPPTYSFERNGQSSVSYSGQTDRLNQLEELKAVLVKADGGETVSESDLLAMFENTNEDGGGNFSFTSTKQLKNKTFDLDQTYFEDILKNAAAASVEGNKGTQAADGTAGLITRSNSNTILVDENGFEFTQMFEKGLMGATFYYQTVNVYLSDSKIGPTVNNSVVDPAKNFTDMEHHWDEAFGYFGAPVDFDSDYRGLESPRFWAKYCNSYDSKITGLNADFMDAFKTGRAAIIANEHDVKFANAADIQDAYEVLAAACAIHYANQAKSSTNQGDILHVLSECYAFTRALRYSNPDNRQLTPAEVETLLTSAFGGNLWTVTTSQLDDLINTLSTTYNLESVKDIL